MDNYTEIPANVVLPDGCLSTSQLPFLFLASYYGDPLTEKTQRRLSKSEFSPYPLRELAQNPSWQRKLDRKLDKAISVLQEEDSEGDVQMRLQVSMRQFFRSMMDEVFEYDSRAVVYGMFEQMKRDVDGEGLVTGLWCSFEEIANDMKQGSPNEPITIFFEYLLSYKRIWIGDDVEIALLMLIAFLEFESLCSGNKIGYLYEESKYAHIPLRTWIPAEQSGNLKTTRYTVLDYCHKNIFKEKTRTTERFRGEPQWNSFSEKIEYSSINIKAVIPYFGYGPVTDLHKMLLEKKVQFAYFFGWYQIRLFESGLPAHKIVELFGRIEYVRESFYTGLLNFAEHKRAS